MIELKLTFSSFEDAADAMLKLAGQDVSISARVSETVDPPAAAKEEPAAKKGRKPKADETPKQEEAQQNISTGAEDRPDPETAGEPAFASEEEAKEFFQKEVRPALSRYMGRHGQDAARKFLNDFEGLNTAKLTELPVGKYRAFVAACGAA